MTQCLVFALACNLWHIFALFWFWGQKCDDTTICFTFSISFIQKEMYKKLHASARLLTICNTLGWSLSVGYTTKFLHLGTPRRSTQVISLRFWWPRYNPIYWVMRQCCVTFVVAHVLWVILDVEFDGNIHFYVWLQFEVKVRSRSGQIGLNIQTQNFHYEACLSCPVLSQDSKNDLCFDVRRLEMPKKCISETSKILSRPYSDTPALRSNSFSLRDVLVIRNRVTSKPLT